MKDYDLFSGLYEYFPVTGKLVNRKSGRSILGTNILGRKYHAHRIAYLLMTGEWPVGLVDHIDLNPKNNRWANLRDASYSDNACNKNSRSDSQSGVKGLSWSEYKQRWVVQIRKKGVKSLRRTFKDKGEAENWLRINYPLVHGKFARSEVMYPNI